MKILHIVSSYPPYNGGMGNVVFEEVSRLVSEHEVHVATLALAGQEAGVSVEGGVVVHRLRAQIRWVVAGLPLGILSLIRREKFDLLHLHLPFFGVQEMFAVLMWFFWRPKIVVSYHMDIVAGGFIGFVDWISRKVFLSTVLRRARVIFVASLSYARSSFLAGDWDLYNRKIVVAPFGVDSSRFFPVECEGECCKPSLMRFIFLGGLDSNHYFKGLEYVLDAFEMLKDRGDWELWIGGDGDLRASYVERMEALGLGDRIRFFGRIDDVDLAKFYSDGDVFLFPSVDRSEAFGLVALEAQACSLPVIASALDGVRDVVVDGETGVLVEPRDVEGLRKAVVWFLGNRERAGFMGASARRRVLEEFSWDAHISKLNDVYEEISN